MSKTKTLAKRALVCKINYTPDIINERKKNLKSYLLYHSILSIIGIKFLLTIAARGEPYMITFRAEHIKPVTSILISSCSKK